MTSEMRHFTGKDPRTAVIWQSTLRWAQPFFGFHSPSLRLAAASLSTIASPTGVSASAQARPGKVRTPGVLHMHSPPVMHAAVETLTPLHVSIILSRVAVYDFTRFARSVSPPTVPCNGACLLLTVCRGDLVDNSRQYMAALDPHLGVSVHMSTADALPIL